MLTEEGLHRGDRRLRAFDQRIALARVVIAGASTSESRIVP
jgi:hypothetical protein